MKDTEEIHFSKVLVDYIARSCELDQHTIDLIAQHAKLVIVNKGETLLYAGEICKYLSFIISGEAISSFNDFNGKIKTWFFHFNLPESTIKNIYAVDYKSFLSAEPASVSITALSQLITIRISKQDFDYLLENSSAFKRYKRLVDEKTYGYVVDRVFSLLTMTGKDRYEKFLLEEPHLLNVFSNYHIASYLGIAPESLSRIRKIVVHKNTE